MAYLTHTNDAATVITDALPDAASNRRLQDTNDGKPAICRCRGLHSGFSRAISVKSLIGTLVDDHLLGD